MADPKEHDSAGIEVVHELPSELHSSSNVGTRAELAGAFVGDGVNQSMVASPAGAPAQDNTGRLKQTIVRLVVAIILLTVLVIVLGAVLGTKLHRKSAAPTPTSTGSLSATSTSSPTASPSTVRKTTAVSVTGWRSGSEFSIRLFYQGDDAYLRIIGFESSNRSWTAPLSITQAKPGTPIAASSFNKGLFFAGFSTVWNYENVVLEFCQTY
jgi:hypothetical protein